MKGMKKTYFFGRTFRLESMKEISGRQRVPFFMTS